MNLRLALAFPLLVLALPIPVPAEENRLEFIEFRQVPLGAAMRLLSEQTGLNIVPSAQAAAMPVSLYLRGAEPLAAIEALARSHDLWFRLDGASGVVNIYTREEYERDLLTFREERTEVFTLLYPNAPQVAQTIRDLFGERVRLSFGIDSEETLEELEQRFERFDLLDERSQGLGQSLGSSGRQRQSTQFNNSNSRRFRDSGRYRDRRQGGPSAGDEPLRRDEVDALLPGYEVGGAADAELLNQILRRRSTINISVLRQHNLLVVRASDPEALEQIAALVRRLDVPTPQVLLEVKVLSVDLGNEYNSVFDFDFIPDEGNVTIRSDLNVLGFNPSELVVNYVGDELAARLEMLEAENRVTRLAAPVLLTANNEVSQIFIGRTLPIVVGFESDENDFDDSGDVVVARSGLTPITETRDVGTLLLMTPNINADRTVTLRILQETSEIEETGTTLPVVLNDGFGGVSEVPVDTVSRRTVSGTFAGRDGEFIMIGGLIDEEVRDIERRVPILGSIPLVGLLFRSQDSERFRTERITLVRPFVLSTPADVEGLSRDVLERLSVHPNALDPGGSLGTHRPGDALTPEQVRDTLVKNLLPPARPVRQRAGQAEQ